MEPWLCRFDWKHRALLGSGGNPASPTAGAGVGFIPGQVPTTTKLSMNLETRDIINFNVTSTLVELYQIVKTNWTEDYYNMSEEAVNSMQLATG